MSKLFFERRRFGFECVDLKNFGSEKVKFIFDEPIDGKIKIDKNFYSLVRGICEIDCASLKNGDIEAHLISSDKRYSLGKFIISDGGVSKKCYDDEELERHGKLLCEIISRLEVAEKEIEFLKERINGKPIF